MFDNPAVISLVAAIFGGAGLKVIEYFLTKSVRKDDTATQMRKELRDEILSLREQLKRAEKELEEFREKYFNLQEEFSKLRIDLSNQLGQIRQTPLL